MPVFQNFPGMPGIGTEVLARHRVVAADGYLQFLPGGGIGDYTKLRDPDNPDYSATDPGAVLRLRAGLLLGKVTANNKYANSVLGVTQGAYTSGGTTVTVTPQQAVEIVRRVGSSGNLKFTGPPAASGTVAVITQAYSAVNTSNGQITVTSLGANLIAGAFVQPTDGSEVLRTFLADGWEVNALSSADVPLPQLAIEGNVDGSQLLPWPADASLRQWVRDSLNAFGKFVFTEKY